MSKQCAHCNNDPKVVRLRQRISTSPTCASRSASNDTKHVYQNNRINDAEKTIANKDNIIKMLQDQLKKMENLYMQHLDESEQVRLKYCLASEELEKFKSSFQQNHYQYHGEKSQVDQNQDEKEMKSVREEITSLRKQVQQLVQNEESASNNQTENQTKLETQMSTVIKIIKDQSTTLEHLAGKITNPTTSVTTRTASNQTEIVETKNESTAHSIMEYKSAYAGTNSENKHQPLVETKDFSMMKSPQKDNYDSKSRLSSQIDDIGSSYSVKRHISFDQHTSTEEDVNLPLITQTKTNNKSQEYKNLEGRVDALCDDIKKITESTQDHKNTTLLKLQSNRQLIEDLIEENSKVQKNAITVNATLDEILKKLNDGSNNRKIIIPILESDEDSVATVDMFKEEFKNMITVPQPSIASNAGSPTDNHKSKDNEASASIQSNENVLYATLLDYMKNEENEEVLVFQSMTELIKDDRTRTISASNQSLMEPFKNDANEEEPSVSCKSETESIKSNGTTESSSVSKPARSTPSKKQLEDSFQMLKAHYADLQNERNQKEKQISWMEDLISYFTGVVSDDNYWENMDSIPSKSSLSDLQPYIKKVVDENSKLKETINSIIDHFEKMIHEIHSQPSTSLDTSQPVNYYPHCHCDLDQEERKLLESCIEECLNSSIRGTQGNPVDSTVMVSNLEQYIIFLQKQLVVITKIEEEIEELRKGTDVNESSVECNSSKIVMSS